MNKANTFKFLTIPSSVASVGIAIVGAELVSVPLMLTAAILGGASVVSVLATLGNSHSNSNGQHTIHSGPKAAPSHYAAHR